jgi:hypothetical protein
MPRKQKESKAMQVFKILLKYGKPTIGVTTVIVSTYLVIFKMISIETLTGIVLALVSAGILPKPKEDDNDESTD